MNLAAGPRSRCLAIVLLLSFAAACTQKETPQQLRQDTAKATAEAKNDAQAIADGVRDGLNRDHPLNLNTASKDQLLALPDMTSGEADRIITGRPYDNPDDLISRRILSKSEYGKISDRVVAR